MSQHFKSLLLTATFGLGLVPGLVTSLAAEDVKPEHLAHFNDKVLPLLQEKCFKCHSHEAEKMKGGLTLDSRAGWSVGGESGPAVVPGKVEKSLLIKAVRRLDDDYAMPPKEKNALSEDEVQILVDWVKHGAVDPRVGKGPGQQARPDGNWWSLLPLKPITPPKVEGVEHPIDAFLSAKRAAAGLAPSPQADRRTQLIRLSHGLHGLPPSLEALTQFQQNDSPEAYEKMVDALLSSPRYGERWARHWLDTMHYADSHGCEHDMERPNAWRFRDYVIGRLNDDVSWPRFIREQLAADVLHPEQKVALGFVGAGPLETSRQSTAPVTFAYLDRDDMVTQTLSSFASTTVHCARCHDHKFDPIPTEDYYSLQSVFAGVDKGDMKFAADPNIEAKRKPWKKLLEAAKEKDERVLFAKAQLRETEAWTIKHQGKAKWEVLEPSVFVSTAGADLKILDDGSILAGGKSPKTDNYVVTATPKLKTITAIKLEVLPHDSLPHKGPGRNPQNGNLHLNAITCRLFGPDSKEPVDLPIASATADFNQQGWTISHVLDDDPRTAWGIHPREGKKHYAVFVLKQPVAIKAGSRLAISLDQSHGDQHVIGRFRLSVSDAPPGHALVLPPEVQEALETPKSERSKEQRLVLAAHVAHELASAKIAALPSGQLTGYGINKKSAPLVVHVLKRGDIEKPTTEAHPGALSAVTALQNQFQLSNPMDESLRRAALADWLASPDNPLTWRSIVNRVWQYHFGRGICDTPNDFGRMGGTPSHPELLDWLAIWFRDEAKGSLKQLHRLIVTSEAYRQGSAIRSDAELLDGDNRLLWRMNAMRLDAEQYRDSVRQITGRLDLTMGGPGIKQFIQSKGAFRTPNLNYDGYDWRRADAGRRDIYRLVWRGIPDPFMAAMDFPNLGMLAPKRSQAISPLQSLVLFNHDFVLTHAELLAEQLNEQASMEEKIQEAYRRILLREPGAFEQARMQAYAEKHGLAATCRLLFNVNEFLYVK